MKRLFLLAGVAAMIFSSCTQDLPEMDQNAPREVIFNTSGDGLLKADGDCSLEADYAIIQISDVVYTAATFVVNDVLYTQAIKLPPGTYTLQEFVLWNDNDTPDDNSDDLIVSAAPHAGAPFADLVINALEYQFDVQSFLKVEIEVGTLCYEEFTHDEFGFVWFKPNITPIKAKWFFGDFCTKFFEDYTGSSYENQTHGLQIDMPAIYEMEVWLNGELVSTFSNDTIIYKFGEAPLPIEFVDYPETTEEYELKLNVLVKVGDQFEYKYFKSFFFTDDGDITTDIGVGPGPDGVYDFVIGNCLVTEADFSIAPHMNLPESGTMTVRTHPSTDRDAYFEVKLGFTGTGYDIIAGDWYDSFCFDPDNGINMTTYNVTIYSSLFPELMPFSDMENLNWNALNWLANHFEQFSSLNYTWEDVQHAVWKISDENHDTATPLGGVAASQTYGSGTLADKMSADAEQYGADYIPLPGGWAAVSFMPEGSTNTDHIQIIFIIVDP